MSNQDWTSKLQDQLAGYQESVSHDLWAGIEQSLAQKNIESVSLNPQTIVSESSESTDLHVGTEAKKNARIVYFKRWSAAAAAVALLGIGGSYVYLHQEDVEKGNLQLASHTVSPSHAVSASHVVSADLQSAASSVAVRQSAPSHVVSSDLQSAASQSKMGNTLVEESENEISLLAEIWLFGNGVENVLGHILWVRGGEAYTHIRHSLGYHVQELGEGKAAFLALARW